MRGPPEDPWAQRGWFRANCHALLRHKSDKFIANAVPGSVVGMHNAVRDLPPSVDIETAREQAERALAEQREWRGLE